MAVFQHLVNFGEKLDMKLILEFSLKGTLANFIIRLCIDIKGASPKPSDGMAS